MTTWATEEFGDTWAAVYDEVYAHLAQDGRDAAAWLLSRAGGFPGGAGPRVLEVGVGTGRIALPLVAGGAHVVGLDASKAMLQVLADKATRSEVEGAHLRGVQAGMDAFTPDQVGGPFDLVVVAFNTLFALPDQDRQIATLRRCAAVLADDGEVVVETSVPQPWRLGGTGRGAVGGDAEVLGAGDVREDQVAMEVADHDPVSQTIRSARVVVNDALGVRTLPLRLRYVWPSELDLMARLAGLEVVARYGGWDDLPFDRASTRAVTVLRRPG